MKIMGEGSRGFSHLARDHARWHVRSAFSARPTRRGERPAGRAQLLAKKGGHLGACSVCWNWYRSLNAA